MKSNRLTNPISPKTKTTWRNFGTLNLRIKRRLSFGKIRGKFTGKELDPETGLYYFGARYLDPKTSRWLSGDPAVGEYVPSAPVNDEAKKRNGNLPGQGGVFNYVNLHVYHYAGNNPVKYVDPDGERIQIPNGDDRSKILRMINSVSLYTYEADSEGYLFKTGGININRMDDNRRSLSFSNQLQEGIENDRLITIGIGDEYIDTKKGMTVDIQEEHWGGVTGNTKNASDTERSSAVIITGKNTPSNGTIPTKDGKGTTDNATKILVHELTVHAIPFINNRDPSLNNENVVRQEMGWPERANDFYHPY